MFVMANEIESSSPNVIVATGNVEARQDGQNFFADWLLYDTSRRFVEARGNVRTRLLRLPARTDQRPGEAHERGDQQ